MSTPLAEWDDATFLSDVTAYMDHQGLSRYALACRAGVHHSSIYLWFDQKRGLSLSSVAALAAACDLSLDRYVMTMAAFAQESS